MKNKNLATNRHQSPQMRKRKKLSHEWHEWTRRKRKDLATNEHQSSQMEKI